MHLRRKVILSAGIIITLALSAWYFFQYSVVGAQKDSTKFYMNWIYTATFSGEVACADKHSEEFDLNIELVEGGEGRDPLKLVSDGDFGIISADDFLRAFDRSDRYRIIGVVNDRHPAVFASASDSGIKEPQDFEGRTVGVLPFGATTLIYPALLEKTGVNRERITEVPVSFDVRPFMNGRVDVQPIFAYDETVVFEEFDFDYNVIDPKEYGVNFKGQVYFTTAKTIEDFPDRVLRFTQCMIAGWQFVAQSPKEAIVLVADRSPTLNADKELKVLERGLSYFVENERPILDSDPSTWDEMMAILFETGNIQSPSSTDDFLRLEFVRDAHEKMNLN